MMMDLVIVSMHEKGFPQADLYEGCGDLSPAEFEDVSPSSEIFFTMKKTNTLADAVAKAKEKWPTAKIVEAADDEEDEDD